jgi:hypothetical protein
MVLRHSIRQDVGVKKDQRIERLVLTRRAESALDDQVIEKRLDVRGSQVDRVFPFSKPRRRKRQKPPDPKGINVNRVLGEPFSAGNDFDLFEKLHDPNIYRTLLPIVNKNVIELTG